MKNLFFALLAITAVAFTSCGDDEKCANDLAGTYTGSNDCAGVLSDATLTITGTDGSYAVTGLYTSDLEQEDCTLSFSNTLLGVGEEVEFTFTDSTAVTVVQKEAASGTVLCTFTGTK